MKISEFGLSQASVIDCNGIIHKTEITDITEVGTFKSEMDMVNYLAKCLIRDLNSISGYKPTE